MNVRRTLELIVMGNVDAPEARRLLHGQEMPNEIALLIKDGKWAHHHRYPTGAAGMRLAARDALDLMAVAA